MTAETSWKKKWQADHLYLCMFASDLAKDVVQYQ